MLIYLLMVFLGDLCHHRGLSDGRIQYAPTLPYPIHAYFLTFGRFVPYLDLRWLRPVTPDVSNAPRMM